MPFPFVIGGIATSLAAYGAKKIYDKFSGDDDYDPDDEDEAELRELQIRLNKEIKKFEAAKKRFYSSLSDVINDVRTCASENIADENLFSSPELVSINGMEPDYKLKFKDEDKDLSKITSWLNDEKNSILEASKNSQQFKEITEIENDLIEIKAEINRVKNSSL